MRGGGDDEDDVFAGRDLAVAMDRGQAAKSEALDGEHWRCG